MSKSSKKRIYVIERLHEAHEQLRSILFAKGEDAYWVKELGKPTQAQQKRYLSALRLALEELEEPHDD